MIRATTSWRARLFCARCTTVTARPFLAAYNAGPGRYDAYVAARPLPAETIAYVAAIAPLIGADPLPGNIVVAVADPLAWTQAPLFIARRSHSQRQSRAGRHASECCSDCTIGARYRCRSTAIGRAFRGARRGRRRDDAPGLRSHSSVA
jgi:hypothetical protein